VIRRIARFALILLVWFLALPESPAQQAGQLPPGVPQPQEGDYIPHDFHFKSGETLAELRLHYMTFGKPARDANGRVTNAVPILHGTGGSGRQFLAPQFAGCCSERDNCWTSAATT
jgi:homoserine O-acetyltransferase